MKEDYQNNNQNWLKLQCKIHKKQLKDIDLYNNSGQKLICEKCIGLKKKGYDNFISIDELMASNQNSIIKNLSSKLIFQEMIEELQETDQERWKQQLTNEVNLIFENYKNEMIQAIGCQKEQILQLVNKIEDERSNIYKMYNKISERQKIINLFNKPNQNVNELNISLTKYVKKKQECEREDQIKILELQKIYEQDMNYFKTDSLQKNLSAIIQCIYNLKVDISILKTEEQQESQIKQKELSQQIQQQQLQQQIQQQQPQQPRQKYVCQEQQSKQIQQLTQLNIAERQVFSTLKYNSEATKKIKRNEDPPPQSFQNNNIIKEVQDQSSEEKQNINEQLQEQQENKYEYEYKEEEEEQQQYHEDTAIEEEEEEEEDQEEQSEIEEEIQLITREQKYQQQISIPSVISHTYYYQSELKQEIKSIHKLKEFQQSNQTQEIHLLLNDQQIESSNMEYLYSFLQNLTTLTSVVINLSKNNLNSADILKLSRKLCSCQYLKSVSINLTENQIAEEMKQYFKDSFQYTKIQNLILNL